MSSYIFDRISFWSIFLVIVLLPVFCLPFSNIPTEISKGLLVVFGLTICIISWAMARFYDGKIVLPKSFLLLSGFGVVLAFFLSSIFSPASNVSLFGVMFDVGTFYFIFAGFLLMFFSSIIFKDSKNASMLLIGILLSFAFVLLFQSMYLFLPKIFSLSILNIKTDNIVGSWTAFGFFAGLSSLISLLIIEFFSVTKNIKWFLTILLFLGLVLVTVVNSTFIWEIFGIFALIIFIYKASISLNENQDEDRKLHFPMFSFVVFVISLLLFMSRIFVGGFLLDNFGLVNTEISPSFKSTMSVAGSALEKSPILGFGPNRFEEAWALYKPTEINSTKAWDVSFNSGFGLFPTFFVTTGYLGIFSWFIFFILFIVIGIKSIFSGAKKLVNSKILVFFSISLFLFTASFFYATGFVLFLLAFVFTGAFIGLLSSGHNNGEISISFSDNQKKGFFFMFLLIVVMVLSIATSFKYGERFVSVYYFRKAVSASSIPNAESYIDKALALYSNDLYLRTYAQIYLIELNSLANKKSAPTDEEKALQQASLNQAIQGMQLAMTYDSTNYLNFQAFGTLYQNLVSLGIKDANSQVVEMYKRASSLNPLNPRIKVALARASFLDGNKEDAKTYADAALTLKPDYLDALIFLSQIAKDGGDNKKALSFAQTALSLTPNDKDLIKYVDSLKNEK